MSSADPSQPNPAPQSPGQIPLAEFVMNSPCAMQIYDTAGRILCTNHGVEELFGSVPPSDYALFSDPVLTRLGLIESLKKALEGQEVWIGPIWYNPGDARPGYQFKPVHVQTLVLPIHGNHEKVEGLLLAHFGASTSLHDEAFLNSDARFRALCENSIDSLFWIRMEDDGGFRVEGVNAEQEHLLNMKAGDIVGKRPQDFLPRETAESICQRYRACLESGQPMRYEEELDFIGEVHTFQTMIVPLRDSNEKFNRIIGTARDITEQKRDEERRRQLQKIESLGLLAGGIAHDFNNLLTAMIGNLEVSLLQLEADSPARPYLERLGSVIQKASGLTGQMLAYAGKGRFVVEPHDLSQIVSGMADLLHASVPKKVQIHLHLQENLPAIEADLNQIHQIIMNLTANAWEALSEQEGTIEISTRKVQGHPSSQQAEPQPKDYVVLQIRDTGCGMDKPTLDQMFDPFFTTKHSGRGLGLSAVQGILKSHGAHIQVESAPGKGTCITVYFPAIPFESLNGHAVLEAAPLAARGRKILLVDDEDCVRQSSAAMLKKLGFDVELAVDGLDALEKFQLLHQSLDLVLMDITMPRMDGREALQQLQAIRADIPVILCSGFSQSDVFKGQEKTASSGFLPKPFSLQELETAVRKALREVGQLRSKR